MSIDVRRSGHWTIEEIPYGSIDRQRARADPYLVYLVAGASFVEIISDLYAGNPLDTGRGRLIPTTSVDEYFADLALWFGVDPSALDGVLPNIARFYDPGSGLAPVGFLG